MSSQTVMPDILGVPLDQCIGLWHQDLRQSLHDSLWATPTGLSMLMVQAMESLNYEAEIEMMKRTRITSPGVTPSSQFSSAIKFDGMVISPDATLGWDAILARYENEFEERKRKLYDQMGEIGLVLLPVFYAESKEYTQWEPASPDDLNFTKYNISFQKGYKDLQTAISERLASNLECYALSRNTGVSTTSAPRKRL